MEAGREYSGFRSFDIDDKVIGAESVRRYLSPDSVFHDAEIQTLSIDREGTLTMRIWTWSMGTEEYISNWTFTDVRNLNLSEYNPGGLIDGVRFQEDTTGRLVTYFDGADIKVFSENVRITMRQFKKN